MTSPVPPLLASCLLLDAAQLGGELLLLLGRLTGQCQGFSGRLLLALVFFCMLHGLSIGLPIGMSLECRGRSDLQGSAPPLEHEWRAHLDAHAVAARIDDEVTSQVGGKSAAGGGFGIGPDGLGACRHPGGVAGEPGRLSREHDLPGEGSDQERRGQRAEELD